MLTDPSEKYNLQAYMSKEHNVNFLGGTTSTNVLTLYINNEIALKAKLEINESGEFQSMHDNKELTVECAKSSMFDEATTCLVHLNKKRIGKLAMKIER